jgi:hypothetical protein
MLKDAVNLLSHLAYSIRRFLYSGHAFFYVAAHMYPILSMHSAVLAHDKWSFEQLADYFLWM